MMPLTLAEVGEENIIRKNRGEAGSQDTHGLSTQIHTQRKEWSYQKIEVE